jgi:drug/metabolite transporter (DMT)-like permease
MLALGCHFALETPYIPTGAEVPYLVLAGLGPLGGAFYLWDLAMKEGDPRVIGTLAYATPLLSTALLALATGGTITSTTALAGALILAGGVVGTLKSTDPET